jgi:hypothetical protein
MFIPNAATLNSRASALVHWPFPAARYFGRERLFASQAASNKHGAYPQL